VRPLRASLLLAQHALTGQLALPLPLTRHRSVPPGCLLPAYQRNFANGTGTGEVVTSLLSVRGWAEWIGSL
jgi:hypothetical protein